jgi:cell wall-associated NlpC family hydrolase
MKSRLIRLAVVSIATAICVLALPSVSAAAPSIASARAQARALQSQVDALNTQMEIVVERYDAAAQRLAAVKAGIATNQVQLAQARYELALARQQLATQVVAMYKTPGVQFLDVALSVRSFSELATQFSLYDKVGQQSAATVQQIGGLKSAIEQRRAELVVERGQAQRLVGRIGGQKRQIRASLRHRQQLLDSAHAEVRRIIAQVQAAKAAAAARAAAAAAAQQAASSRSTASGGSSQSGSPGGSSSRGYGGAADIRIAQRYLGVPYVWGGASPAGFDCSGLVMYVFAQLGVSLPHNAAMQFTCCTPVPRAQLQPGDLVFFGSSPATIHHVGIYVGDDTMIDAPCTGEVVQYDTLFSDFYSGGRVD